MNKEKIETSINDLIEKEMGKIGEKGGVLQLGDKNYAVFTEDSGNEILKLLDMVFEETYSLCSAESPVEVKKNVQPINDKQIAINFEDITAIRSLAVDIEEIITKNSIKSEAGNKLMKIANRIFNQNAARTQENDEELEEALEDEDDKLRKFECPSCGTIIRSTEPPKSCSCGRKGGFKEITGEINED